MWVGGWVRARVCVCVRAGPVSVCVCVYVRAGPVSECACGGGGGCTPVCNKSQIGC